MKRIFRSRLPLPLTSTQIKTLSEQSHLSSEDIEDWYERFNHCYPRGYLSCKEFISYLQQLYTINKNQNYPPKSTVKQLFRILDLDENKQLNFEEFFIFHVLINQGSEHDKLKLIFQLYGREKDKFMTKQQLENVLITMFDLFNISKPKNGLAQRIDLILTRSNFNNQNAKISWHTFTTYVLNDSSLFQLLVSDNIGRNTSNNDDDDNGSYIITRF